MAADDQDQDQDQGNNIPEEDSVNTEPKEKTTQESKANEEKNSAVNQKNSKNIASTSQNNANEENESTNDETINTDATESKEKTSIKNSNVNSEQTENINTKNESPVNEIPESTKVLKLQKLPSTFSNYSENLRISSSNARLSLKNGKESKEENLLSQSTTVIKFSPAWKQTLAASGSILLTFTSGLTTGYSGVLLPQLKNETNGPIHYDENTASWIASMAVLPMAAGCLISGYIMEKFGRKNSHYILCAPFLLGWILIACASNLIYMLAGRFFTGLSIGLLGPVGAVYMAETSDPKLRGFFLAGISLAISLGIFVAHMIGTFMTWQWTATICCLFPILSVALLALVPESPTWLISKGKIEEGVKSFYWLRGYGIDAKIELKGIIDSKKALDSEPIPTWRDKLANLKSPEFLKPLLIMSIFFMTCQFSGVNAVAFYSIEIVEKAVGTGIDHYLAMLLIDALRIVMSIVACVVCKQYGRRPLCMISGIWTAISMIGLSIFLYWKPENMVWLPLTCLMVYITAISIGLVPLPWIMCGEVFPLKVRGLGSGISTAFTFTMFFIVVKTAPGMMTDFGEVVTFLVYGLNALIGTAILFFILPETRGKSLQEIEERFRSGKRNSSKGKA